jgi:LPXTG-motif cell wall-anchored protein
MTGITLIDDKCSTTTLISGDTNGDAKLDVTETWIYRCSMTLSTTTTNTVVATGWANGLSSIDIANAIVVVGLPVVPPLIHVTKIPSPLTLFSGAGLVTYTERITNPGTVALSNVILTDDKCSPMKYISGDTNGDSKLDTTETWLYTCAINLATTTTNTAVATGEANGLTAKDFAIATVIVTSPSLPNTGLGTTWSIVLFAGLITLVLISLIVVLRRKMM